HRRDLLCAVGSKEGTHTLMPAVQEVIVQQGIFCALYGDRASHFFVTPKAGGKVDEDQITQLGRACRTLRMDLAWVFSIQHERRVNPDNTSALDDRILQIEKSRRPKPLGNHSIESSWRSPLLGQPPSCT